MEKKLIKLRFLIIIFSAIMIISPVFYGCNKKAGTSAKAKTSAVEKIDVKPEIPLGDKPETEKGYTYDPAGRHDPFVPLVVVSKGEKKSS
ncbi:MAG: hypothetical protein AABZ36_00435, partial [Nitrospirota bacterium]